MLEDGWILFTNLKQFVQWLAQFKNRHSDRCRLSNYFEALLVGSTEADARQDVSGVGGRKEGMDGSVGRQSSPVVLQVSVELDWSDVTG